MSKTYFTMQGQSQFYKRWIFLMFFWTGSFYAPAQNILQYRPLLAIAQSKKDAHANYLAIRSFTRDAQRYFLLIHPDSLNTFLAPAAQFQVFPTNWNYLTEKWADKPYIKAWLAAKAHDKPLQDAGITHLPDADPGISLTADLCPSEHPLDRAVFTTLERYAPNPVSIALSVSGLWMMDHGDDLEWLQAQERSGALSITWMNHSLHHHWDKKRPLHENFLLERGTNLETEVLGNEELMIEKKLLPSCFFRFPGLVSDQSVDDQILDWGLLPVGSDAWLAKKQYPKNAGSIVLIHTNGNEPIGLEDFLRLLKQNKDKLQHGAWRLYDLRSVLEHE